VISVDEYGNYHLVKETLETGEREYMDFQGKKCFLPKEYTVKTNVPLSVIDEFTCHFVNEDHMRLAITKEDDMGNHKNKMYITYNYEGERRLSCVYDDEVLAHVASKTVGSKKSQINTNDSQTMSIAYAMFNEILRFGSTFATDATKGDNSNSYSINNHNVKLLRELHRTPPKKESEAFRLFRGRFLKDNAFGSYKEFRALYLNYKQYKNKRRIVMEEMEKERDNNASPIVEEKKEDSKAPVQLSMFEMLKK
jgi:hypothetical protein